MWCFWPGSSSIRGILLGAPSYNQGSTECIRKSIYYLFITLYDLKAPLKFELGVGNLSRGVFSHFQGHVLTKGGEHHKHIVDIYLNICCQELQHIRRISWQNHEFMAPIGSRVPPPTMTQQHQPLEMKFHFFFSFQFHFKGLGGY